MMAAPIRPAQAAWIPGVDPMIKQGLEEVAKAIKGIINATLKTALVTAVGRQLEKAIGSSGTPIVIWSAYLFDKPLNDALEYGYNMVGQYTRGQQEGVGFAPNSTLLAGGTGPAARLAAASKEELKKIKNPINVSNIGQIATVNDKGQLDVFDPSSPSFAGYFALYKSENNLSLATAIASETKKKEKETVFSNYAKQVGAGYDTNPGTSPITVATAKAESALIPIKRAYLAKDWTEIVASMSMKLVSGALQGASSSMVKKAESASSQLVNSINDKGAGGAFDSRSF